MSIGLASDRLVFTKKMPPAPYYLDDKVRYLNIKNRTFIVIKTRVLTSPKFYRELNKIIHKDLVLCPSRSIEDIQKAFILLEFSLVSL